MINVTQCCIWLQCVCVSLDSVSVWALEWNCHLSAGFIPCYKRKWKNRLLFQKLFLIQSYKTYNRLSIYIGLYVLYLISWHKLERKVTSNHGKNSKRCICGGELACKEFIKSVSKSFWYYKSCTCCGLRKMRADSTAQMSHMRRGREHFQFPMKKTVHGISVRKYSPVLHL